MAGNNIAGFYPLDVGSELSDGRYVIINTVGKGTFGIIYSAYDRQLDRTVAIKEFFPDGIAVRSFDNISVEPLASSQGKNFSEGADAFYDNAKMLSELNCVGIPSIYDYFYGNGTAYCSMEFIHGITLIDYVEEAGALSAEQTVFLLRSIAETLVAIHGSDILHRDISPENIMLCRSGDIKLIDFGAARSCIDSSGMTVILKYGYAPQEQYRRSANHGPYSDIYSLGMSAFFGMTGVTPENCFYRSDDDTQFSELCNKLPEEIGRIISKAAALGIEERYRNASELLSALDSCSIKPQRIILTNQKNTFSEGAPETFRIGKESFPADSAKLDLQGRELTNAQIAKLRHFKNLKHLNLRNNYITDLSVLQYLPQLEQLYFDNNVVYEIDYIGGMHGLKVLSCENNEISDISSLENLTQLEEVFLGDNSITDITPLKNCRNLHKIGINEQQVGNIEVLRGMYSLEMVCMSGCGISDISPLEGCTGLEYVYLGRNRISDFSVLRGCKCMHHLILDNNGIDEEVMKTLYGVNVDTELTLNCNKLTAEHIETIRQNIKGNCEIT